MIRAVVDTSVLVSAFIGRPDAAPARFVAAWRDRQVIFVGSPQLVRELDGVLARPKLARWSSDGRAAAYVSAIAAGFELHGDSDPEPATRDPDDDYLVALARAAHADLIVSVDHYLLDAGLEDVLVARPEEFLRRLDP